MNEVKQNVSDTMVELMHKKSIDKITVKELVEQSGISRQAFYYHFKDILDVIEWTFEKNVKRIAKNCAEIEDKQSSIKSFADEITEHYPEMRRLLNSKLRAETEMILLRSARHFCNLIIESKFSDYVISKEEKDFMVDFFSCGMTAFFAEKCMSSKPTDTETFSREMYRLVISRINFQDSD
ncbi:MAG: TetR family transcriptional regulator [Ruminococcus sp.]|nr:TetR family transcriptional regulator [Ruminococcus sp.]